MLATLEKEEAETRAQWSVDNIGQCVKCHEALCVATSRVPETSGKVMVVCGTCGNEHPDHPLLKTVATREVPKNPTAPHTDNPSTIPERVLALEKTMRALSQKLTFIEKNQSKK